MKIKDLYIGFTKEDGKERCFLKKFKEVPNGIGHLTATVYIDLLSKEKFTELDIDSKSLIPFKQIYPNYNKKKLNKRKVISTYKADRNTIISAKDLFYLPLLGSTMILKKNSIQLDSSYIIETEEGSFKQIKHIPQYFKDLKTNRKVNLGSDCNLELIKPVELDKTMYSKKKILEMNYKHQIPFK